MNEHRNPTGPASPDREDLIEASARTSYNFRTYLKEDDIRIEAYKGIVVLKGTVSEDFHKSLAEETVSSLPGVRSVENRLVVPGDQPGPTSDAWITLKVKALLALCKDVSAMETQVHTHKGIVSLSGHASSEEQRRLADACAKEVDGVLDVHNTQVVSTEHRESLTELMDDASITAQVKLTILLHDAANALGTKVTTQDGVVTLTGEARDVPGKDVLSRLAERVKDVKLVNNRMTIPPP